MNRRAFWSLALLSIAPTALAYETQTHAFIVSEAEKRSVLEDPTNGPPLLKRLGFDRLSTTRPFGLYWLFTPANYTNAALSAVGPEYYDNLASNTPNNTFARSPQNYEQQQMVELLNVGRLDAATVNANNLPYIAPFRSWIIRGAIREDDLATPADYGDDQPTDQIPDTDPRGGFQRSFNHFYDPINNVRLHYPILGSAVDVDCSSFPSNGGFCYTSVDWAMGTLNTLTTTPSEDTNRHNHFTWWDARNNYFWALTQQGTAGDGATYALQRETATANRMRRWATAFHSLGNVLHLLGDAAQPQHTRNDPHTPYILLDTSAQQAYEPYTNARVLHALNDPGHGGDFIRSFFGSSTTVSLPDFDSATLDAYPIPQFKRPQDFFTTRSIDATVSARRGMADYSNRGFFTAGTLPPNDIYANPPTPISSSSGYTVLDLACTELSNTYSNGAVQCQDFLRTVPDTVSPGFADHIPPEYAGHSGQVPMATQSEWDELSQEFGITSSATQFVMRLKNFQVQSDFLLPRAIGYSAGLINYFFRGTLEVTSPPDKIVAVLNQGATHSMTSDGYPCVGSTPSDGCAIFGFQKVRVSVRNITSPITEAVTGTSVPQTIGTSDGSNTQLVAVARYHRNTCYTPTLSGERVQAFSGTITEPTCGSQTVRTTYQEISVSAPLTVTSGTLDGLSAGVERDFDFSGDPIPVNATDLFIQIIYKGPMADEVDGMAVGILDTREPTFAAFWNNTDYFWNGSSWVIHNGTNHNEGVETFWSCAGGFPLKMIFEYDGAVGSPAMIDPVVNSGTPGMVRLAIVFPPPDFAGQGKTVQGTPVHFPGDAQIAINQGGTTGQFRQGNLENLDAATLTAPVATCSTSLPTGAQYWCFDPVKSRRGQVFGAVALPMFLAPSGGASSATDVDSVPLPAFAGMVPLTTGTIRFNTDTTLASCSAQPAVAPLSPDDASYLQYLDLIEEARNLGVSDEGSEPPSN